MRPAAPLLLLTLAACQVAPPPPSPAAAVITFSARAVGPKALAGGAVVLDPGPCPAAGPVRVVGAGLPAGQVTLRPALGEARTLDVRADGSFDATVAAPGGEVAVAHGQAAATLAVPACPAPSPSMGIGDLGVVQ